MSLCKLKLFRLVAVDQFGVFILRIYNSCWRKEDSPKKPKVAPIYLSFIMARKLHFAQ